MAFAVSARHTAATVKRRIFDPEEVSRETLRRQRDELALRQREQEVVREHVEEVRRAEAKEALRAANEARKEALRAYQEAEHASRIARWRDEAKTDGLFPRDIIRHVASEHGLGLSDILGASRKVPVVVARFHAFWEVKRAFPNMSTPHLGRVFGGRDHSTAINALSRWPEMAASRGIPCNPIIKDLHNGR